MESHGQGVVEFWGFFSPSRLISAVTLITIYPNDHVFEGFWHQGAEKRSGRK